MFLLRPYNMIHYIARQRKGSAWYERPVRLVVDQSERLDKFLARMLPTHSRTKLAKLISEGGVLVDGRSLKSSATLEPGMSVEMDEPTDAERHDLTPADIELEVVYEDSHLLVVNKPRGLAAHPAASLREPSLVNALLARSHELSQAGGEFRPGIVHRLDKDTTGLMVVAKTDVAHVRLARQIEGKTAERRYFAIVAGNVDQDNFKIQAPIARDKRNRLKMAVDPHGKPATTVVHRIARIDAGNLLAVKLETGRTHQIRVHLSSLGMPVLGDRIYAPKNLQDVPLQLHAAYLSFDHPVLHDRIVCFAPPPNDFMDRELATQESLTTI
jgi:23S rRNA pseudouridine1911/1915/1917 synthase